MPVPRSHAAFPKVELLPFATLGRYELLVPIADGGMASIWAARETVVSFSAPRRTGSVVALKMILPEMVGDEAFEAMFLDEARLAARIRHPNVCETFELGNEAGVLYLAMEWVDGPSLLRLLRLPGAHPNEPPTRLPIPPRIAAHIVAQACAGLHASHELVDDDGVSLGVVHRDVSPHNVLVSAAGAVKITDFGVAKARGSSHATVTGELKGKVAYMSPEQLRAAPVDRRSDIFGLGCVLYEITTGRRPFEGDNDGQVVRAILGGRVEPPGSVVPDYPAALEEIVLRALSPKPDARFGTADAMRQALEAFLARGAKTTARDVAGLVAQRWGIEGVHRREEIRAAAAHGPHESAPRLAPSTPTKRLAPRGREEVGASTGSGLRPMPVGALSSPSERRSRIPIVSAAVVALAFVVGLGAWSFRARVLRDPRPIGTIASSSVPPPPAETPAASASVAIPPAPTPPDPAQARVTFSVTPPNAMLIVDGVVMPKGVVAIDRPSVERGPVRVMFRADRHEDYVEVVDQATPSNLVIRLAPRGWSANHGGARAGGRPPTEPARHPAPSSSPSSLPNPYE